MKHYVLGIFLFCAVFVLGVVGQAAGQALVGSADKGGSSAASAAGAKSDSRDPFACLGSAKAMSSEQGSAFLARVQSHYSAISSMRGSFHQESYVAALDEGETSSGTMVFAKPGRMRWSYKQPRVQEVVIRDGELWMYQPDKNQLMIDSIGAVLLSKLPVSFLMGLGNIAKDFELKSSCRSSAGVILTLIPRRHPGAEELEEALEGFVLLVDESQSTPKGAKITSVGGNTTAIVFKNLQVNPSDGVQDKFVLDYPKGVDILDRRTTPGF